MKPNVLFFAPVAFFKGGAENSLQDLLHNPGVSPILAVPAAGPLMERAQSENIPVEIIPFGAIEQVHRPLRLRKVARAAMDSIRAAAALKAASRKHSALCVHTNGMKAHLLGMLARLMGGAPVVAHVRDIAYTRVEKLIWKLLAVGCHRVVLVSRACWPGETLPPHVAVVHNGISLPDAKPPPAPAGGRTFRLGFCGRVDPIKGLELLLDWMALARAAGTNVHLFIRGEGREDYVAFLKQKAEKLRLGEVVTFEGPRKGLAAVYAEIDAVVVPSQTPDPLPRSVMEAMAMGLPVLGYPAGGIPDMIEDGRSGFLVKDGRDFLNALGILSDRDAWACVQKGGLERVSSGFTLEALYANLERVYAPLHEGRRA